ncbi:hypothetical protein MPH_13361 [Macrophomina phaseolina MS6]|uniref:Uncharacterized protein n=1 Tax=Macrophomina phaseolina (strain MS6) TaxID=1126212 RepID=K2RHK3_MACPH|nr:hypothetical protein MPH_13361 [Macrophomina phaseolina MS6]
MRYQHLYCSHRVLAFPANSPYPLSSFYQSNLLLFAIENRLKPPPMFILWRSDLEQCKRYSHHLSRRQAKNNVKNREGLQRSLLFARKKKIVAACKPRRRRTRVTHQVLTSPA